jgi:hypothetical protein
VNVFGSVDDDVDGIAAAHVRPVRLLNLDLNDSEE